MTALHTYQISSISFRTNVYLPELNEFQGESQGAIWVVEKFPDFFESQTEKAEFFDEENDIFQLRSSHFGEILIVEKREIYFIPNFDKGEDYLRMVLLGSISMIYVNCFNLLSLHAASIVINDKAILFCGASGRGKSSIAAYFYSKGYHVLADDVTNCGFNESGELLAYPSVPRIKLSEQVLIGMGISSAGLLSIPSSNVKYSLPIENRDNSKGYPIQLVILPKFESNTEDKIVKIVGVEKYKNLSQHIYRKKIAKKIPYNHHRHKIIFDLSTNVSTFEFIRSDERSLKLSSMSYLENFLNKFVE